MSYNAYCVSNFKAKDRPLKLILQDKCDDVSFMFHFISGRGIGGKCHGTSTQFVLEL